MKHQINVGRRIKMLYADQITKTYAHPVLQGLSFEAHRGEIVGIAGENGCGKSTLLSILTTVTKPDSGVVTIDGEDINRNPKLLKLRIGYVPQENALFEDLSVTDNVKFWAAAYGKDHRNAGFDVDFLRKKVRQLSGGMKKRLSIRISLLNGPDFIIMDEPTTALDIGFKSELSQMILDLKSEGKCVILTSHQPDELLLCDRLYLMRNGVFDFVGAPSDLCTDGSDFSSALYGFITRDRSGIGTGLIGSGPTGSGG